MARVATIVPDFGDHYSAGFRVGDGGGAYGGSPPYGLKAFQANGANQHGTAEGITWVAGRFYYTQQLVKVVTLGSGLITLMRVTGSVASMDIRVDASGYVFSKDDTGNTVGPYVSGNYLWIETCFKINSSTNDDVFIVRINGKELSNVTNMNVGATITDVGFGSYLGDQNGSFEHSCMAINDEVNDGTIDVGWLNGRRIAVNFPVSTGGIQAGWRDDGGGVGVLATVQDVTNPSPVYKTTASLAIGDAAKNTQATGNEDVVYNGSAYSGINGLNPSDRIVKTQLLAGVGSNNTTATNGQLNMTGPTDSNNITFADAATASTTPSTWPRRAGTVKYFAGLDHSLVPVMSVRKVDATSRHALLNSLGVLTEWMPVSPPRNVINQRNAIRRASRW